MPAKNRGKERGKKAGDELVKSKQKRKGGETPWLFIAGAVAAAACALLGFWAASGSLRAGKAPAVPADGFGAQSAMPHEQIFAEGYAHVHRIHNVVTPEEAAYLIHALRDHQFSRNMDEIDGKPYYELFPVMEGETMEGVTDEYAAVVRRVGQRVAPVVREIFNMPEAVPCSYGVRRYRKGERTELAVHKDADNYMTAVVILQSADDGSSGSYISTMSRGPFFMTADTGDAILYAADVRHGVNITGAGKERYSMPVWFQESSAWCHQSKKKKRTFRLRDRDASGFVEWGEWVTSYLDFDHDYQVSQQDWTEYLKQSGTAAMDLLPAEEKAIKGVYAVLRKCDTDKSGSVDRDEMTVCGAPWDLQGVIMMTTSGLAFFNADVNKDMKLSLKEWKSQIFL
ncbi:hypothetical protein DIPPA_10757 [Diplonema papillatum]|nr:hypothetical protein DIPPA_10757 [Diplonema papillatum]